MDGMRKFFGWMMRSCGKCVDRCTPGRRKRRGTGVEDGMGTPGGTTGAG
jgi:hypothetical protein